MAVLEVKNLTKTYGKGNTTVTALGGVSFSVDKGDVVLVWKSRGMLHLKDYGWTIFSGLDITSIASCWIRAAYE